RVKDANGCIMDTLFSITQPTRVVPGIAVTPPLCYGGSNGKVAISGTGGTPGYTFAIGSGSFSSTNNIISGLAAGTYVLRVKDANECIRDTTVTVTQPPRIVLDSLIITHVKCNGGNSGVVVVYSRGGTMPHTYARNNNP